MDAMIRLNAKKLDKIDFESKGEFDPTNEDHINRIKEIKDSLSNDSQQYAETVHYNNIISGFRNRRFKR